MLKLLLLLFGCCPTLLKVASDEFIQEVVDRHNYWRVRHGVGPITADPAMNKAAQYWADFVVKHGFLHSPPPELYGENISVLDPESTGRNHVDKLYLDAWFYRKRRYCLIGPDMTEYYKFKHYTQIVWKSTTKIGVGKAGKLVIIYYSPRGNREGHYGSNVPCIKFF